jgi:hypothetical protein
MKYYLFFLIHYIAIICVAVGITQESNLLVLFGAVLFSIVTLFAKNVFNPKD